MENEFNLKDIPAPNDTLGYIPDQSNYLVWAIIVTIFCCNPCGIVSIVFSALANQNYQNALYSNNSADRQRFLELYNQQNHKAKTWIIVSVALGIVWTIIYASFITVLSREFRIF